VQGLKPRGGGALGFRVSLNPKKILNPKQGGGGAFKRCYYGATGFRLDWIQPPPWPSRQTAMVFATCWKICRSVRIG
jgi:hypothetical protein